MNDFKARKEDLFVLKVDLDLKYKKDALASIKSRFSYMHDLGFLKFKQVESINLVKKTNYSAKIRLKKPLKDMKSIVLFQLMLGSDYRKEINTLINHYSLNMKYSNRMFDIKRYKGGEYKIAKIIDVTTEIYKYISSGKRTINMI